MFSEKGEGLCSFEAADQTSNRIRARFHRHTANTQTRAISNPSKAQRSRYSAPDISFLLGGNHRGAPSSLELLTELMESTLTPTAYIRERVVKYKE